jgi:tetratricopeptide (TPR) repeat protein
MDLLTRGDSGPYLGRLAFGAADQDVFFARDQECAELKSLWADSRLVVMHGPAGSGKTSLLRAGLQRTVLQNTDLLPIGAISASSWFPEAVLPDHNPYTLAVLSCWSPAEARTQLSQISITDFLVERTLPSTWSEASPSIVAVIDQLEGIFTDAAKVRYRDELFNDLAMALEAVPHLKLLLSIRSDSLSALETYGGSLGIRSSARVPINALEREAALEAVVRPAEKAGISFAPGVAEAIVGDLCITQASADSQAPVDSIDEFPAPSPASVEPVQLQVVCLHLYRTLPDGVPAISLDLPEIHKNVDRYLAEFCTDVICETAAEYEEDAVNLRNKLIRSFVTSRGARKLIPEEKIAATGLLASLVHSLENKHLLTAQWDSGRRWYMVANDRLASIFHQLNQLSYTEYTPDLNAAGHLRIALKFLADGDHGHAEMHAWRALRSADSEDLRRQANVWSLLGNIAFEQGYSGVAEEYYRRAAELSEQLRDESAVGTLLGAIGRMQAKDGHDLAALEDLHSAVTRLPGDLTMKIELAKALWHLGQRQAAAAIFGTVLTIEPQFAEALAGRGQIRAESGDASSALDDLRTLRQVHPSMGMQPEVRSAYALALARSGRPETAMKEADAVLADSPDNGLIFLRAARVADVSGAPDRATVLLHQAAKARNPALSDDQLNEVSRLLAAIGSPDI